MKSQVIKLGSAQGVAFEVVDVQQATGFGLHVAASPHADATGSGPELFLRADSTHSSNEPQPDDRITFTYYDGGRAQFPTFEPVPRRSSLVLDPGIVIPDMLDDPSLLPGIRPLDAPSQANRFDIDLGRREGLTAIEITLTRSNLTVDARRRSVNEDGWPREFSAGGWISLDDGDLAGPALYISNNGLLSAPGASGAGAGAGWKVLKPSLFLDGGGSDDGTLGTHTNIDTDNNPAAGGSGSTGNSGSGGG